MNYRTVRSLIVTLSMGALMVLAAGCADALIGTPPPSAEQVEPVFPRPATRIIERVPGISPDAGGRVESEDSAATAYPEPPRVGAEPLWLPAVPGGRLGNLPVLPINPPQTGRLLERH